MRLKKRIECRIYRREKINNSDLTNSKHEKTAHSKIIMNFILIFSGFDFSYDHQAILKYLSKRSHPKSRSHWLCWNRQQHWLYQHLLTLLISNDFTKMVWTNEEIHWKNYCWKYFHLPFGLMVTSWKELTSQVQRPQRSMVTWSMLNSLVTHWMKSHKDQKLTIPGLFWTRSSNIYTHCIIFCVLLLAT